MRNLSDDQKLRGDFPKPTLSLTPLELLIAKEDGIENIKTGLDAEILIFLADFAAKWPQKWRTVREKINRRSNSDEIARYLGINRCTVTRHLKDLKLEASRHQKGVFVNYEGHGYKTTTKEW